MRNVLSLSIAMCFSAMVHGQHEIAKAMIEMDKRMTNYDVFKVDTQYYDTGQPHKLFYYDTTNALRKTTIFSDSGNLKTIVNRNKKDELDGMLLSLYETGELKSFSIYNNNTGFSYTYYKNGRIKIYSQSKDTYPIGYEATFCSEGSLYYEAFHDSADYIQEAYHCNGDLRFKGRMLNEEEEGMLGYRILNQRKDGIWKYWDEDGNLIEEEHWEKGELIERKVFEDK